MCLCVIQMLLNSYFSIVIGKEKSSKHYRTIYKIISNDNTHINKKASHQMYIFCEYDSYFL